jgi:hypothetical protein
MTRDELIERLREHRASVSFPDAIVDKVADSADSVARIGAAFTSALNNAGDSYKLERERQLHRRADRLLALANAGVSIEPVLS